MHPKGEAMFAILQFLRDRRIDHTTSGARSRPGWVQINCPFCGGGSRGYDLGVKIDDARCACWRCRGKHISEVVRALTKCGPEELRSILSQYGGGRSRPIKLEREEESPIKAVHRKKQCKLPAGTSEMMERHFNYLDARGYDPELLEEVYGLKGTGRLGDYAHRIILPITFEGRVVSFQGRDITGRAELRYKACAMVDETVHHKHVLYGWDLAKKKSCVIVEGAADAWRLGPGSLATFGTGFTAQQAALLAGRFSRVFLAFDPEPQAQKVAEELAWVLSNAGVETVVVELDGTDPGDMAQKEADALMKEMGLKGWNR
jgi:DNA primase (bacterial type)